MTITVVLKNGDTPTTAPDVLRATTQGLNLVLRDYVREQDTNPRSPALFSLGQKLLEILTAPDLSTQPVAQAKCCLQAVAQMNPQANEYQKVWEVFDSALTRLGASDTGGKTTLLPQAIRLDAELRRSKSSQPAENENTIGQTLR